MSSNVQYSPGPANVARVEIEGEKWTLVLEKELRHSPERVWQALTDPAELREWAPFDSDGNLGVAGAKVNLSTFGAPQPRITETTVACADSPRLLEYKWGDFNTRWQLEPSGNGTRLTLWTNIDRRYIAMGAAGWHICFDVLEHLLDGSPLGRMAGPQLMGDERWQRLNKDYATQFKVDAPAS